MGDRKQRTPKGYEIPVPQRDSVMDAFERIAGQPSDRDPGRRANRPDGSPEGFKKPRGSAEP